MRTLLHGALVLASALPFALVVPGVLDAHRGSGAPVGPATAVAEPLDLRSPLRPPPLLTAR